MDRTAFNVRDASLTKTAALPNGAASVQTAGIDLGALSARGTRDYACELLIKAPALGAAALPDAKTMTYKIQASDDAAFGSAVDMATSVIVQTGAGGAGSVAKTFRWRIPGDCKRYIRVMATGSAAGDASGASMTAAMVF